MAVETYLEIGKKRVFAGALAWPGWCRSGRDENAAIEALLAYGERYGEVLRAAGLSFAPPKRATTFEVVERVNGDATTDFGAPSTAPRVDEEDLDRRALARQRAILEACWAALDRTAKGASGKELRKGPRGGGRELDEIVGHVIGAEASYARMIRATPPSVDGPAAIAAKDEVRATALDALERAVEHGLPEAGPRGGKRWSPRYFVRRAAWHVLDHAWEIEDRST